MGEDDHLSTVIGAIYDASLDSARWPSALEQVCGYVNVKTSNLIWRDAMTPAAAVFHSHNFDPEYQQKYFETYARIDPFYPGAVLMPVGEVFVGSDIIPHEEFRETRYYREWVKPQGYIEPIIVNLERSAAAASSWVALRGEEHGEVDAEALRRFARLVPHVMRSVTIGRTLDFHKSASASLSLVLESVSNAVVLVGADGRIVHANPAAAEMLAAGTLVREQGGRLLAAAPGADLALVEALRSTGLSAGGTTVSVGASERTTHVAQILSLTLGERQIAAIAGARIAVFLRPVTSADASPLAAIAKCHGLTPSELRVLTAVSDGGTVAEMADRLGIAPSTVKTHLLNLFAKTGAKRQSDLVRLLAFGDRENAQEARGL